jgi:hypothetical protein
MTSTRARRGAWALVAALAVASVACSPPAPEEQPELESAALVLPGFDSISVPLVDGEGTLRDEEGTLRVRAALTDWRVEEDLDGDGVLDAVVVAWSSGGGSGTFMEVVHFRLEEDTPRTARWTWSGSAALGDRVRIRAMALTDGLVELHVTEHGPDDPMCCPTVETIRAFEVRDGTLVPAAGR